LTASTVPALAEAHAPVAATEEEADEAEEALDEDAVAEDELAEEALAEDALLAPEEELTELAAAEFVGLVPASSPPLPPPQAASRPMQVKRATPRRVLPVMMFMR